MSKNIVIQEGGAVKQLTVDKLKTNLAGGGTQLWVPEDSVELTTKSITANGTYRAGDDGYYGYSEVTVNVPGGAGGPPGGAGSSIVGKDSDGDDAIVTVDPETGELEEEKLPNHIYVVTPPYNPRGIYADGETIDIGPDSGFDVRALLVDGAPYEAPGYPMGDIPLSELTVEPTTAVYDAESDYADVTADIDTSPVSQPIATRYSARVTGHPSYPLTEIEAYKPMAAIYNTDIPDNTSSARFRCIIATDQSGELVGRSTRHTTDDETRTSEIRASRSYTYDDKTVYYADDIYNSYYTSGNGFTPVAGGYPSNINVGKIAWALLYGEYTSRGSHQTINVSWPRPGDGQVLETTFEIRVGPSPSGDDDN